MKMILTSLLALVIGCSSCTSKAPEQKIQQPTLVQAPTVATQTVVVNPGKTYFFDNLSLTFDPSWEKEQEDAGSAMVAITNETNESFFTSGKVECKDSFDDCMKTAVKSVGKTHMHILSTQDIMLNGQRFFLLTCKQGNINIWNWITLTHVQVPALANKPEHTDNFTFVASCGGVSPLSEQVCKDVMHSLKVEK